jgi:hypothetical protein
MGTPAFMARNRPRAPEGTTTAPACGAGAVLYFLLTGRAPFMAPQLREQLRRVIDEERRA